MPGIAKRLTFSWGKRQHMNTHSLLRNFTVAILSDFLFNIRQKTFWLRLRFVAID